MEPLANGSASTTDKTSFTAPAAQLVAGDLVLFSEGQKGKTYNPIFHQPEGMLRQGRAKPNLLGRIFSLKQLRQVW